MKLVLYFWYQIIKDFIIQYLCLLIKDTLYYIKNMVIELVNQEEKIGLS